jgi:hypothetical protein
MKKKPKKLAKKKKELPLKLNGTFEDFMKAAMGKEVKEKKE